MHLILSRVPYSVFLYGDIIEKDEQLILTDNRFIDDYNSNGYIAYGFDDYHINDNVVEFARKLFDKYDIKYIHVSEESDIERAAYLRGLYNIIGQDLISAIHYRDKFNMKLMLKNCVNITSYYATPTKESAKYFIENSNNSKFVIKPRKSWSSNDMHIINSIEDIDHIENWKSDYMIEAWVESKKMYCVDGIKKGNKIIDFFIHEYDRNVLESTSEDGFTMITSPCNEDKHFRLRIKEYLNIIFKTLDKSEFCSPFHLEFFLTDDDNFCFCEIASRFGGGKIIKLIDMVYGIKLHKMYIDTLCNRETLVKDKNNLKICGCYKKFRVFKDSSMNLHITEKYNWIKEFTFNDKKFSTVNNINDVNAIFVFECNDINDCYNKIEILESL